ncbi:PREDICTED: uncharacterized protein LOC106747499 [Dinoponera quadriceps]|uniref:Uncharacterized protein LOC106747499 n=1 Tax=Dinoponera quadriceps TaxID=609295 RepID=A0A6P3XPX0_DINQU|nr:PREDICTED: uncharacterized protein LOC106747499 [Dinoponera quadriceps]
MSTKILTDDSNYISDDSDKFIEEFDKGARHSNCNRALALVTGAPVCHVTELILNLLNIEFLMSVKQITKFERLNNISINVSSIEKKAKMENQTQNFSDTSHRPDSPWSMVDTTEFPSLSLQVSDESPNLCLYYFYLEEKLMIHAAVCREINDCAILLRDEDNKWLSFGNHSREERTPFVVYADLECMLEKIAKGTSNEYTLYQHHKKTGEEAPVNGKKIDRLATELYESATNGTLDTPVEKRAIHEYFKCQALINFQLGLNVKLQIIVRHRAPTTLAKAIAGAMDEEKVKGLTNHNNNRETALPYNSRPTTYPRIRENVRPLTCHKCNNTGHLGKDCHFSRYAKRYTLPKISKRTCVNTMEKY